MNGITIHNRSDGKQLPIIEGSSVLHLLPAKCVKTKEGLIVRLLRDKTGWCWESPYRDGSTQF